MKSKSATNNLEIVIVIIGFFLFFELVNFILGQDINWDLLNYHISSAHKFIYSENWSGAAISQRQSWFNPLPYVPAYLLIQYCPTWLIALVFGALPVLNVMPAYLIVRRFLFCEPGWRATAVSAACTFVGATSTIHLAVVGTSLAEAWLSSATLFALYAMLSAIAASARSTQGYLLFVSGMAMGAAVGLKLTNAPMAIGLAVALIAPTAAGKIRPREFLIFALAGVAGFAVLGGWWHWQLWQEYGNPVFPMYNNYFASPMAQPDALTDGPRHWWHFLTNPVELAYGSHSSYLSTSMPVRDSRQLVALMASFGAVGHSAWSIFAKKDNGSEKLILLTISIFYISASLVWFFSFNIARYAMPLELLSGVMLAFFVMHVIGSFFAKRALVIGLALLVVTERPIRTGRTAWTSQWIEPDVPAGVRGNDTLYVMTGWQPLAWLTVFADRFGERVDFVRVSGNLAMAPSDAMGQFVSHRITSHQGPIRSLTNVFETAAAPADLARFKLAIIASSCMTIRSKADPVQSCALRPLDDGARHDSESASSI